jgi:hypothetical protein
LHWTLPFIGIVVVVVVVVIVVIVIVCFIIEDILNVTNNRISWYVAYQLLGNTASGLTGVGVSSITCTVTPSLRKRVTYIM